jgi:hypothetical protein
MGTDQMRISDTEVPNQVLPYASFNSGTQCFVTLSEIIIMFFSFICYSIFYISNHQLVCCSLGSRCADYINLLQFMKSF